MGVLEIKKKFENHCTKWNRAFISIISNTCTGRKRGFQEQSKMASVHIAYYVGAKPFRCNTQAEATLTQAHMHIVHAHTHM